MSFWLLYGIFYWRFGYGDILAINGEIPVGRCKDKMERAEVRMRSKKDQEM